MVIRYKNTFTDVLWFAAYTYTHSPVLLCIYALFGIISFYAACTSVPSDVPLPVRIAAIAIVFILLLSIFFVLIAVTTALSLISRANRTILTDHSITIGEDGLTEETQFNRTQMKWTGIQRLVRTRRHIIAYVSQYGAHVIPRRAFSDRETFDAFYAELQARVQRAT